MKEIKQTKKAKREFHSPALLILNSKENVTRKELARALGTGDRGARKQVEEISMHYAIIAHSRKKGYRLAKPIQDLTLEEAYEEKKQKDITLNDHKKAITMRKRKMKPLIAYGKILDQHIAKLEGLQNEPIHH